MLKKLRNRFLIILLATSVLFITVGVQLSNLTMAQSDSLTTQSEDRKVRTLTLKGSRGQIMDTTGIPLAYDQSSFDIEFTRDPSRNTPTDKAYYTQILIEAIQLIEENEGTVIDTFNIVRGEDGAFAFDFGVENAEHAAKRETNWRSNMYVNSKLTPDEVYRELRNRYRIPEEYTYEQARPLLSIWQEVQLSSYRAYIPVKIAKNVPIETVAVVEARSVELDGIGVAETSTRVYPKDDVAAHIIGYTGRIVNDTVMKEMESKGYSQDDSMGMTGIESSMEAFLTGNSTERQGQRKVEINSKGKVIKELEYTAPTPGNDVMLTVDLQLQMALEEAVKKNVESVHEKQLAKYEEMKGTKDDYDTHENLQKRTGDTTIDKLNLAKSGAAVVMDVHTGKVLAMASYPSFDLNLFSGGISDEDFKMLSEDDSSPLFNKAVASKGIPGSIFKMVTGTAGLMEGVIDENTVINDESPFDKYVSESYIVSGGRGGPSCWVSDPAQHANGQTLTDALEVSCNYYFFEVADRLGIDKVVEWSDRFGLMTKTNIELPEEVSGQVGNQEVLYNPDKPISEQKTSLPYQVRNQIIGYLKEFGKQRNVTYDDAVLEETADQIVGLVALGHSDLGPEIRAILAEKMEIPETITKRNNWDGEINIALTQLQWNKTRTALTGIGTDITSVTPIAVARYVASLVNGGIVYDAQIVDRIVDANGNIVEEREPRIFQTLDVSQEALELIKDGMGKVVSSEDGSAGQSLEEWKYKDQIGGKTGTGKVSDVDLENNAWFVAFAPYDDPEIVVVNYIPNGMGGNYAVDAVKDIIEYYMDGREAQPDAQLPAVNSLVS